MSQSQPTEPLLSSRSAFAVSSTSDREKMSASSTRKSSNGCVRYFQTMAENIRLQLGDTKLVVHILVATFAIASWADMNGMWSELPQLTIRAPEQWTLPSYIIIISQIANIGPILFVVVSYLWPRTRPQLEISVSFFVILLSMVSAFLMGFFWHETGHVAGEERSIALLALNFFLAIGDCTSSVCFYAYISLLKPQYVASLLLGEGFSGLIPGMLALIQGAGDIVCVNSSHAENATYPNGTEYNKTVYSVYPMYEEPLFSVKVYFIIVSAVIALSAAAFVILNSWSYCSSEFVKHKDYHITVDDPEQEKRGRSASYGSVEENAVQVNGDGKSNGVDPSSIRTNEESSIGSTPEVQANSSREMLNPPPQVAFKSNGKSEQRSLRNVWKKMVHLDNMSRSEFLIHMFILIVVNMTLTTFLPTIQIYTVLPYGLKYYHLTTSLIQMANPVACFFAVFVMAEAVWVISVITLAGQVIVAYLIYVAALSPEPPMHDQTGGGDVTVSLWILVTLLLIYAKVCVAGVMRKCGGRGALVWAGFVTQVGTTIGALVGFVLVNHYEVFRDAPFC